MPSPSGSSLVCQQLDRRRPLTTHRSVDPGRFWRVFGPRLCAGAILVEPVPGTSVGVPGRLWPAAESSIYTLLGVYTDRMAKHLVDIDDDALSAARAQLGTETIKETVNQALRRAGQTRSKAVTAALDRLARADLAPREDAWR
jgi:Arc/MetJ family transcription regulator